MPCISSSLGVFAWREEADRRDTTFLDTKRLLRFQLWLRELDKSHYPMIGNRDEGYPVTNLSNGVMDLLFALPFEECAIAEDDRGLFAVRKR